RLGFAALTGPVGLTIAAITAAITVFVTLYKKSEGFRSLLGLIKDGFVNLHNSIKNFLSTNKLVLSFINGIKRDFENLGKIMQAAFKILDQSFRSIEKYLRLVGKVTKTYLQGFKALITGDFSKGLSLLKKGVSDALKGVADIFRLNFDFMDKLLDGKIRKWIKSMKDGLVNIFVDPLKKAGTSLKQLGSVILDWVSSMPGAIREKTSQWTDSFLSWLSDTALAKRFNKFKNTLNKLIGAVPGDLKKKIKGWGNIFADWIKEQNEENKRQYGEWGKQILSWFKGIIPGIKSNLENWWKTISRWISDTASKWGTALIGWKDQIIGWFTSLPGMVKNSLNNWMNSIKQWFITQKNAWKTNIEGWGTTIKQWFTGLPRLTKSSMTNWFKSIGNSIIGWKDQLVKSMNSWWLGIKGWFSDLGKKPEPKKAGGKVIDNVVSGVKEKKKSVMDNIGKLIVDGLKYALLIGAVVALSVGRELIKRMIDGIKKMKGAFTSILNTLHTELKKILAKMLDSASKTWTNIKNSVVKKATELKDGTVNRFTTFRNKVSEIFSNIKDKVTGYVSDMVSAVT
ncbi:MAG: hypothetical protein ACI32W_09785, partial [Enterococcus faecalis]